MQEIIGQAKQSIVMGKERFLKTFSFVPDDKLTWSPTPSSKSALRIAAHIGISNQGMAGVVRGEKPPFSSMAELFAMIDAEEQKITTRDAAVQLIEASTNSALAALDALTPEQLGGAAGLPGMEMPMAQFIMIIGMHMSNHAAQIDYLQTTWGDLENHF
jgi:hypothetical protein